MPPPIAAKLAARTGSPELTDRELDVLRRIVAGRSNKEIATDLGITEGTVKTHVNRVLEKLGAVERQQEFLLGRVHTSPLPGMSACRRIRWQRAAQQRL